MGQRQRAGRGSGGGGGGTVAVAVLQWPSRKRTALSTDDDDAEQNILDRARACVRSGGVAKGARACVNCTQSRCFHCDGRQGDPWGTECLICPSVRLSLALPNRERGIRVWYCTAKSMSLHFGRREFLGEPDVGEPAMKPTNQPTERRAAQRSAAQLGRLDVVEALSPPHRARHQAGRLAVAE